MLRAWRIRPRWWPDDEQWPPRDRRHWRRFGRHNPFFRRLGCLFIVSNLFGLALLSAFLAYVLHGLGLFRFSVEQLAWLLPASAITLAIVLAVLALAAFYVRRLSRPLDDILRASDQVAEGDYLVRVREKGPPEVRSMARAFNSMASRLQVQDEQRRAMLADVTHELRTPLTVIQGNLEGVLDGLYEADESRLRAVLEEVQILSRLTDDLRILTLAENNDLKLRLEPADLELLIRDTAAAFRTQADQAGVRIELSLHSPGTVVEIDPGRIRQVLVNLMSNALRYSHAGKHVKITSTVVSERKKSRATVSVEDQGPGIAPQDLPHIFDRYYRSVDSRGMGLGLSIAKHIIEAHGGDIWVESSADTGTRISFDLPV